MREALNVLPDTPPDVTSRKLFEDKTPSKILFDFCMNSIDIAKHTDLTDPEGHDVLDLIVLLSRKLLSVWLHQQAYQKEQDSLARASRDWPPNRVEYSQELYEEFDVFSVQIKSTLDHLVNIMRPILGRNRWTLQSFSDKGDAVLNALKRNAGRRFEGHVRQMEYFVFTTTNKAWLTEIIDARDQVNHGLTGGLKIDRFTIHRDQTGTLHLPMWHEHQRVSDVMEVLWTDLLCFVENFVALALNFRVKPEFALRKVPRPAASPVPSWQVMKRAELERYLASHPHRQI